MKEMLEQILSDCAMYTSQGHVATYIPELANVDPDQIGICISMEDGTEYSLGVALPVMVVDGATYTAKFFAYHSKQYKGHSVIAKL